MSPFLVQNYWVYMGRISCWQIKELLISPNNVTKQASPTSNMEVACFLA